MRSILFALAMAFSCQSFANFISYSDGSDGTYGFTDESTGLQWLSLELTLGLSIEDMLDTYLHYDIATSTQFDGLVANVFKGLSDQPIDYRDGFGRDIITNPDGINDSGDELIIRQTCQFEEECFSQSYLWHSLFLPNSPDGVGHSKFALGSAFNASGHIRTRGVFVQTSDPKDDKNYAYVYTENFRSSSLINTINPVSGIGAYLVKLDQPRVANITAAVSEPASFAVLMLALVGLFVRRTISR